MKFDPKKTSEKRIDNDEAAWLIEGKGGWMIFARGRTGDRWGEWVHYWPDGQKPEGIFLDETEAREWANGAAELLKKRWMQGEIVLVKIGSQEKILSVPYSPPGVKEWRPPETAGTAKAEGME